MFRKETYTGKPGDLIQFYNTVYCHWGVRIENDSFVHVKPVVDPKTKKKEMVIAVDGVVDYIIQKPFGFLGCKVNNSFDKNKKPFSTSEIIERATSKIGENWKYDVMTHNCEHFAHWCRYGIEISRQALHGNTIDDGDGNLVICGQLGGTNVGIIDFKLPSFTIVEKKEGQRKETRANIEYAKVGLANQIEASVGVEVTDGTYDDDDGIGYRKEMNFAKANVGPVKGQVGLSVSSGIDCKDGVKAEVLGTGLGVSSEGLEVKVIGTSVGIKWPWKWF